MQGESLKKLDYVFQELERRIVNGQWKVGDLIPTEAKLAAEFHCSPGTVSKAIARLTHAGMVERRTRAGTRVIQARAEKAGAALDACAFIFPSHQHEGIARLVWGFQQEANLAGRRTLMLPTGNDFRKEAEIVGRLGEFDVKGAALYPVVLTPQDQIYYMQMILACRFPVVLVGVNLPGVRRPAVISDGPLAGVTMTRHLLARGARRIGFLANHAWIPSTRDRYLGYRQAMLEAGLPGEGDDVHLENAMTPDFADILAEPTRLAREFLAARPGLDAVLCGTDFLAHGCLRAAAELGLDVPGRLKVAGIDGFESLGAGSPPLTTYRMPFEEMGRTAFRRLAEGGDAPDERLVRGDILARESA